MDRITTFLADIGMTLVVGTITYAATDSLVWMVGMQLLTAAYGMLCHHQGGIAMGMRVRATLEKTLALMEALNHDKQ